MYLSLYFNQHVFEAQKQNGDAMRYKMVKRWWWMRPHDTYLVSFAQ